MKDTKFYLTPQEAVLGGDRHDAGDALKEGKYWTPNGICTKEVSIEQVNSERARRNYLPIPLTAIYLNRRDAVIGLNQINSAGESADNPPILVPDEKTNELVYSQELTEKFYTKLREAEEEMKKEAGITTPELYSFFIRESSTHQETEGPSKNLEGMKNV